MSEQGGHNHRSTASSRRLAFILSTSGRLTARDDDYPAQKLVFFTYIGYRCSLSVRSRKTKNELSFKKSQKHLAYFTKCEGITQIFYKSFSKLNELIS